MPIYINGIGSISAQPSWDSETVIQSVKEYAGEKLTCIEPDYGQFLDIRQLRRMSRIIKMGMATGLMALKEAEIGVPNGVITGTSYGCLEDTGIFLGKMIDNKENALNPTPFIQSTHNTIGSQIALFLQCQGYNQTYTQRGFSFENALIDSILALQEHPHQSLLTGAADEITAVSHAILRRFNIFRAGSTNLDLFKTRQQGTMNGEGAAYFVLSGDRGRRAVELVTVNMLYKPMMQKLSKAIDDCVESTGLNINDIDLVLIGKSGDDQLDKSTEQITEAKFKESTTGVFKHLTGEFPTASALAMALACRMIQAQHIPEIVIERNMKRLPKNVLIYNPYFGIYHTLILLRAC